MLGFNKLSSKLGGTGGAGGIGTEGASSEDLGMADETGGRVPSADDSSNVTSSGGGDGFAGALGDENSASNNGDDSNEVNIESDDIPGYIEKE
jgi:hypothetical protein